MKCKLELINIVLYKFAEEKHAELCYAECLLLDSLITFIQVSINS